MFWFATYLGGQGVVLKWRKWKKGSGVSRVTRVDEGGVFVRVVKGTIARADTNESAKKDCTERDQMFGGVNGGGVRRTSDPRDRTLNDASY